MVAFQSLISSAKSREVLRSIRRHGTAAKQKLLEESGLTSSTLTRILEELRLAGLILEVGFGESTGGRRPVLYETNPACTYAFGLDISRMTSRLALFDFHLQSLAQQTWSMTAELTPERLIQLIAAEVPRMLTACSIEQRQVLGLGIGAVGPLDRKQGIIQTPLQFPAPGWQQVPIREQLEALIGLPVLLDNGANTALLGEYWRSSTQLPQHLLYLHAGVGLRSAILTEGHILYSAMDTEGAIGQMIIESAGLPSQVEGGNYGAWEAYVSIESLKRQAATAWKQGRVTVLSHYAETPDRLTYAHLVAALQAGDLLMEELFYHAATYLGIGLANLINILHPEEIILGGPLFAAGEAFFAEATQIAQAKTYYRQHYQVRFSMGSLGDEAVATGAAAMVLSKVTD
jgi:predicted NBD/HSP70 family sugar kinase